MYILLRQLGKPHPPVRVKLLRVLPVEWISLDQADWYGNGGSLGNGETVHHCGLGAVAITPACTWQNEYNSFHCTHTNILRPRRVEAKSFLDHIVNRGDLLSSCVQVDILQIVETVSISKFQVYVYHHDGQLAPNYIALNFSLTGFSSK